MAVNLATLVTVIVFFLLGLGGCKKQPQPTICDPVHQPDVPPPPAEGDQGETVKPPPPKPPHGGHICDPVHLSPRNVGQNTTPNTVTPEKEPSMVCDPVPPPNRASTPAPEQVQPPKPTTIEHEPPVVCDPIPPPNRETTPDEGK